MATRRDFISGSAALAAMAWRTRWAAAEPSPVRLASSVRSGSKDLGAVWRQGELTTAAVPSRGHGMARLGGGAFILMGRRPGESAVILDPEDLERPGEVVRPARDCRFAGHASASPDGGGFVTTEFDAATFDARLVRRDLRGGELELWTPAGIEPHELLHTRHGTRLVVALGGLIHDGGVAGPAMNPGGIDSALLEVDARTGRELARHRLSAAFASLSLRHLALAPDQETVVVGMQDQDLSRPRPLVGVLRPGAPIALAPLPDISEVDFRGYIGSVAVDAGGDFIVATSPRGGAAGLWSLHDLRWLGGALVADICGLAAGAGPGEFWASSGLGEILRLRAARTGLVIESRQRSAVAFDNHLLRL